MDKTIAYVKYVAKAVAGAVVFWAVENLPELVDRLQDSFVDNPTVSALLGAVAVFLVRNGPQPE